MNLKDILIFSLMFLSSCNPVIEAEIETVVEEGIQMRLHALEAKKGTR